jgi:hypothetical protein
LTVVRTAVVAACLALVLVGAAAAADGGSGTYTASQRTYYFTLFNSGTTPWQYFVLVGPAGASFIGGTTAVENSAHCVPGQPDGVANEIECGPLNAVVSAHLGFVATLAAPIACGAPFQLAVSSNSAASFTRVGDATLSGSCAAAPPEAITPPAIRGTPTVGRTLTATPPTWSATPARVAYQWQLCTKTGCASITSATKLSLKLTKGVAGHTVRIVATATFDSRQVESVSKRIAVGS